MSTGIQGPQGYKGARGIQGITGWGAIGTTTGPTGPTGPMGTFTTITSVTTTLTLSASNVSTLYLLTSASLTLTNGGSMTGGEFFVFSNQTNTGSCRITLSGMTINGSASTYSVPSGGSVTLVFDTGTNFITL